VNATEQQQLAWIAERILAGDFRPCDRTTRENLCTRLQAVGGSVCLEALAVLRRKQNKPKATAGKSKTPVYRHHNGAATWWANY
jgi:hypothetical protein